MSFFIEESNGLDTMHSDTTSSYTVCSVMKCLTITFSFPLHLIVSTAALEISAIEYPTESIGILYLSITLMLSKPTIFALETLKYTLSA